MADIEDEDDIPIAELMRRKQAAAAAAAKPAPNKSSTSSASKIVKQPKKEGDREKKEIKKDKSSSSSSSSSSSTKRPQPRSSNVSTANADHVAYVKSFYENTVKGKLIQIILVRWWYAIQWPQAGEIGEPPSGYETLDGYPGVFVGTSSETLGNILDKRNPKTCPCFKNLKKKNSSELKMLCIKALEEQVVLSCNFCPLIQLFAYTSSHLSTRNRSDETTC